MFKLFLFGTFLAFAAAAPAPAPEEIIASYNGIGALPLVSSAGAPLVYAKSYSSPIAYNYVPPYAHFPLYYKTGYY